MPAWISSLMQLHVANENKGSDKHVQQLNMVCITCKVMRINAKKIMEK